jgi:hypothetical protein
MLKPRRGHHRVRGQEFLLIAVFGSLDDCAAIRPTGQWSLCLDREAIEGNVRRLEIKCPNQVAFPRAVEVSRKREDQVERDVVDPAAP